MFHFIANAEAKKATRQDKRLGDDGKVYDPEQRRRERIEREQRNDRYALES